MVTRRPDELELVGGNLALDLANTLEGPLDGTIDTDHLPTPEALAAWLPHAGLPAPAEPTAALLERAHALRAAVYTVFRAVADGEAPGADPLGALVEATAGARLVPAGDGFDLVWDDPLAPIAQAAVDLLRAGPLDRVKLCHVCRWLFVDSSRNRSRRWCSMNECGGRLKMQRYRARRATAGR